MEQTLQLLNAIINIHLESNTGGELPPSMLNNIGKFKEYSSSFNFAILSDHCFPEPSTRSIPMSKPNKPKVTSRSFSIRVK
jgi:hypothetical protein